MLAIAKPIRRPGLVEVFAAESSSEQTVMGAAGDENALGGRLALPWEAQCWTESSSYAKPRSWSP
jgi:hypothetical protein